MEENLSGNVVTLVDQIVQVFGAYLAAYGYKALFALFFVGLLGLPVPEETLLVFSGFLVSAGRLSYVPTLLVCFLGSVSAMTAAYWIGRVLGYPVVEKGLKRVRNGLVWYQKTEAWFHRAGKWALPFGYFLPGVRQWTAYVAGIARLPFPVFALLAYSGGALWSVLFVTLGWQLGARWEQMAEAISENIAVAVVAVLALIAGVSFIQRRKRSQDGSAKQITRPKEEGSR